MTNLKATTPIGPESVDRSHRTNNRGNAVQSLETIFGVRGRAA